MSYSSLRPHTYTGLTQSSSLINSCCWNQWKGLNCILGKGKSVSKSMSGEAKGSEELTPRIT